MTVFEFYTADEIDTKFIAVDERLVAALEALVTQQMFTEALSGLAVKTDVVSAIATAVAAAVEPLASRTWTQGAIAEATRPRPIRSEMRQAIADAIAPLVERIAALEARIV